MPTTEGGWIGVDLDGTLAHYEGWNGGAIGAPIPLMVARVHMWLEEGREVRIFTARKNPSQPEQEALIKAWCFEHIGRELPVTSCKDFDMVELWDDRCVQVDTNTGEMSSELAVRAALNLAGFVADD